MNLPVSSSPSPWRFCIAPMLDWTDRHCRAFHRLLSRHARLYTEMVTTGAILHGDRARLLRYDSKEHPVAVQLGGSDPRDLSTCSKICEDLGYAEINLNCGCPSDRVQNGAFGACLMRNPERIGECLAHMRAAVRIPITLKCRLGVDEQSPQEALAAVVKIACQTKIDALIIHARKAWLHGLSPKENRDIPPLDYPLVYDFAQKTPHLPIVLNGGISSLPACQEHLQYVAGVMVGRAAYQLPEWLLHIDTNLFGKPGKQKDMLQALSHFRPYIAAQLENGTRLHDITRHLLGAFHAKPGARRWRQILATKAILPGAGLEIFEEALKSVML